MHYSNLSTNNYDLLTITLFIWSLVVSAIYYLIFGYFRYKIYQKLNLSNPWAAFVPIYNEIKFLQAGDQSPWLMLTPLIPIVGSIILLAYSIIAAYEIGRKFNKSTAYVLLFFFFSWLWFILLGLKSAQPTNPRNQL